MSSSGPSKKRPLPSWMNSLAKKKKNEEKSSDTDANTSDSALPETTEKSDIKRKGVDEIDSNHLVDVASQKLVKDVSATVTAAQIIEQSMQYLTFKGSIVYSYHDSDCACICLDILSSLSDHEKTACGFDMEWPVSYRKGVNDKTALIQLCTTEEKCYLFHVSAMQSLPKPLKNLLLDPRLVLVGLNIESDLWKLERDFDVRVKTIIDRGSMIDVGKLANVKLKSSERWNLDGLCKNVLRKRLNKDGELRCGNWNDFPLNEDQKLYAASDAYAGLLLYNNLHNK